MSTEHPAPSGTLRTGSATPTPTRAPAAPAQQATCEESVLARPMAPTIWSFVALAILTLALASVTGCRGHALRDEDIAHGDQALRIGDYGTALIHYSTAISYALAAESPAVAQEAYTLRGECHVELGQRGGAKERQEHLESAIADFEKVLAGPTTGNGVLRLRARIGLALAYELLGERAAAEANLVKLVNEARTERGAFLLAAHGKLGWNKLDQVLGTQKTEVPPTAVKPLLDEALAHFDAGLTVEPEDPFCLLGRGIALYRKGDFEKAQESLTRSIERTLGVGMANPRGHFYLARAIEDYQGLQPEALLHLLAALREDPDRELAPLYHHLVDQLPQYLSPEDPELLSALLGLLAFRGMDVEYGRKAEQLFDHYVPFVDTAPYIEGASPEAALDEIERRQHALLKQLVYLGRAICRRRIQAIDGAASDLLQLRNEEDFSLFIDQVFPPTSRSSAVVYGRLRTLLENGQTGMIEREILAGIDVEAEDEFFYRIEGIVGEVLYRRWTEMVSENPSVATHGPTRQRYLLAARDALERHLEHFPGSTPTRLLLGEAYEACGQLSRAIEEYTATAEQDAENVKAYRHLKRLHDSGGLGYQDEQLVWERLKGFQGNDPSLRSYLETHRQRLLAERSLYCRGCGRKARSTEAQCLFCGRMIRARLDSR